MATLLNKTERFIWCYIPGFVLCASILFSCDASLRNEVDAGLINREAGKLVVASFISPLSSTNRVRTALFAKEYGMRLQWTDPVGVRNYYRATAYLRSLRAAQPANSTVVQPITVSTTFFENNGLQADAVTSDGGRLLSRRGVYHHYSNTGNSFSSPVVTTNPNNTTTTVYCTPVCTTYITGPSGTTTISPPPGTSGNPASLTVYINKVQLCSLFQRAELTYSLLYTDENYYRYHDAILRQDESESNPFAKPV